MLVIKLILVSLACLFFSFILKASEKGEYYFNNLQKCEKGIGSACTEIGFMYDKAIGVAKNDYKAVEFYSRGCDLDDQRGCVNLGVMWEKEQANLKRDEKKIMELFTTACEEDYGYGCYFLGLSYEEGQLIKKDTSKAYFYYNKACSLEVSDACTRVQEFDVENIK
ncbi:tetratricopeptide repeat protein [Nitrosophilus kaiyonis]|uniref:tetratricopeptide repeat protein n=1 Tax=Nitrosophilus kaiyonis TaxID=2930200 RepID=UPI0024922698|nr:tetratricopeptide repeat protein [Nitrosophilus kaiyonis]